MPNSVDTAQNTQAQDTQKQASANTKDVTQKAVDKEDANLAAPTQKDEKLENVDANLAQVAKPEANTQENTNLKLSVDERLQKAVENESSFLEQVKVSLLAVNEIYTQYKAIDIHYQRSLIELDTLKKELLSLSDEFKEQKDEALQKIEQAKTELLLKAIEVSEARASIEEIETRLNALANKASQDLESISDKVELVEYFVDNEAELRALITEIENQKLQVQGLVTKAQNDLQTKLDEANANLQNQKLQVQGLVTNAQSALESSANTFIAQVETRKITALNTIDEKLGRLISNINYVSANEPQNARLNDLWLDTNRGLIFKYSKNELIDFYGLNFNENAFAKINDFWHKDDGSLLKFTKDTKGKIWQEIRTELQHINFYQKTAPEVANLELGSTWLKMDWDKVYYLENKSWVQITQKLKRFHQDTTPETSKVIELNDIWQKGDGTSAKYYIYTQFEKNNALVSEWVSLDEAFKVAKFKGLDFPQIAQENDLDTTKAQMRDLFFQYDKSLIYVLVNNQNNEKEWQLLADVKARAKFQGAKKASPLKENLYFFKQNSEDSANEAFYQGQLLKSEALTASYGFVEYTSLKENAQFSATSFPKNAKSGDLFYHLGFKNFYFYQSLGEGNSIFSWRKLDLENISFLQNSFPENAKVGDVLLKDKIYYVYVKFADSIEFKQSNDALKPFLFVNEFANDLKQVNANFDIFKENNKGFDYILDTNPSTNLNPQNENALILNKKSFEIFKCIDNSENKNVFIGSKNSFVGTLPQIAPGSAGFGVGIASNELVNKCALTPMQGCFDSTSDNYGNYVDNSGSIMCFVPKFYVKLSFDENPPYNGTKVEFSYTQKQGYFLPRAFINAGKEVEGFFIDKYMGSNESGVMVSKRFMPPLSTWNGSGANRISPCSELKHIEGSAIPNNYAGAYLSVKSRGRDYALPSVFMYTALAWMSLAHYQACYFKNTMKFCAFGDKAPFQPRGCNCQDGTDYDDKSVKYQLDKVNVYSGTSTYTTYKTASVSDENLGKISHNGQKCGISDINGMQWEVASGFKSSKTHTWANKKFLILKESFDLKNFKTQADIENDANYDLITLPNNILTQAYSLRYAGKSGTSFFAIGDFARTSTQYKCNNIGLSYNVAYEANANNAGKNYGQDGFWQNGSLANMQILVGGCSWDSLRSGLFTRSCNVALTNSYYSVFARACLI